MNEPLALVFHRRAAREIDTIDEWWRANRAAASDLFLSELDAMLSALCLVPTLGAPAKGGRAGGVRRVLLRRSRYHVYYRVRGEVLEVLAV